MLTDSHDDGLFEEVYDALRYVQAGATLARDPGLQSTLRRMAGRHRQLL